MHADPGMIWEANPVTEGIFRLVPATVCYGAKYDHESILEKSVTEPSSEPRHRIKSIREAV